jgi:hypothetical protein
MVQQGLRFRSPFLVPRQRQIAGLFQAKLTMTLHPFETAKEALGKVVYLREPFF